MFKSIDENAFRQAIRDKDYLALKVSTVSTMLDDPTFERGETMEAIQILKEQIPEIFEEEVKLDYEERLEKNAWDKRYFTKLAYWFQENFAISRIDYIKEVGNAVHTDTVQQYNQSITMDKPIASQAVSSDVFSPASDEMKMTAPKATVQETPVTPAAPKAVKATEVKKENFPIAGAIIAVGALVLAGFLLYKLL